MQIVITSMFAFLATIGCIIILRPLAILIGLTDQPGVRKQHSGNIPLVGGIAIYLALLATVLLGSWMSNMAAPAQQQIYAYLAGGLLLVVVGVVDDLRSLTPLTRLLAQICAALIMIFGGNEIVTDLGAVTPSGETLQLGNYAIPFTVFMTVGLINAINMCDGLDGLSGNMTLVSLLGLGLASAAFGNGEVSVLLNIFSAAVAGFLVFNQRVIWRPKASVFLGDAGSMLLGYSLTWIIIEISQEPGRAISPAAALWFLIVPVYDTITAIVRRLAEGKSPFYPDARHLHHLLVRAGFEVSTTIALMCLLNLIGIAVGYFGTLYNVSDFVLLSSFLVLWLLYLWATQRAWRTRRLLGKEIE